MRPGRGQDPTTAASPFVDVVAADLNVDPRDIPLLAAVLGHDEAERWARFQEPRAARRYVVSHAILRIILADRLGESAESLRFERHPGGKPGLLDRRHAWLEFNLSHSDDLALMAFARGRSVGVDVERVRADLDFASIARRAFGTSAQALLAESPRHLVAERFFEEWTALEARQKALGLGLGLRSDASSGRRSEAYGLTTRMVRPRPGYLGAVAARGDDWMVRSSTLEPSAWRKMLRADGTSGRRDASAGLG